MSCYVQHNPGPCANCKRERGAVMGSSSWGHGQYCCGNACGQRLAKKIAGGMLPEEYDYNADARIALRTRIRQLERQVAELRSNTSMTFGIEE